MLTGVILNHYSFIQPSLLKCIELWLQRIGVNAPKFKFAEPRKLEFIQKKAILFS